MMGKTKTVEIVLAAISALVMAAKAIIKFIGYIRKLKDKPAACAA